MIKSFLKKIHLYHPLQSFYRNTISHIKELKYRSAYKKYEGEGFECNVCGKSYRRFVPDVPTNENRSAIEHHHVIAGYGQHIICPNCLSTARERLVIAYLEKNMELNGLHVLHLSPEKNVFNYLKNKKAIITTADLLPGFYKTIDGLVQKQDATRFSYANGQFSFVIGNHIMEHIPEDEKAMQEIFRVLKPGGSAVLQVPYSETLQHTIENKTINNGKEQSALYGQKDHVRIYTPFDYKNRLENAGLKVIMLDSSMLGFEQFAIQPKEIFFKISKPIV